MASSSFCCFFKFISKFFQYYIWLHVSLLLLNAVLFHLFSPLPQLQATSLVNSITTTTIANHFAVTTTASPPPPPCSHSPSKYCHTMIIHVQMWLPGIILLSDIITSLPGHAYQTGILPSLFVCLKLFRFQLKTQGRGGNANLLANHLICSNICHGLITKWSQNVTTGN